MHSGNGDCYPYRYSNGSSPTQTPHFPGPLSSKAASQASMADSPPASSSSPGSVAAQSTSATSRTNDSVVSPSLTSTSASSISNGYSHGNNISSSNHIDIRSREPTVPAACLGCRSKHLKCDGQTPCSRCVSYSINCIYVASRRGYKGPRRATTQNPNKRQATSPPDVDTENYTLQASAEALPHDSLAAYQQVVPLTGQTLASLHDGTPGFANAQLFKPGYTAAAHDASSPSPVSLAGVPSLCALVRTPTLAERCLDSFFRNFHAAHPFVLPKEALLRIAAEGIIEPLLAAMRWVGSLYLNVPSSRPALLDEAERLVGDPQCPRDGFLLQAMMVLLIGLDGSKCQDKSRDILADAEKLAIEIAINTRPFATLHGRGWPVLEESWRRTWWELFVTDGMIAGVHRVTSFFLFDFPADAALPCEEHEYLSSNIPPPMTLDDLENRDFSGDDREFSSFAYRILSARNLGKFMRAGHIHGPEDENLARIETLLTNWRMYLPPAKRNAVHKDGKLDEMMFQAHMMTNAMTILLHQPHSHLDSSPAENINSCAPHRPVLSGDMFNNHTRHTIAAANQISKMITHPVPLLSHTHFFACVITLSSIVHLSKWALHFVQHDDDDLRQQIRLNTGALNDLSTVWACSGRARDQVKGVAQEIYRIKKQQQTHPQYWTGLSQQEVVESIATDNSIIGDIEGYSSVSGSSVSASLPSNFG
ncbi:hypothetical protein S7711_04050 [Stachybotrys chartarum IBT 7711]|uniref:Zn(2)-C6 fungal-type domain-containing protein n=1 Tax=Stachybotrys chartarum (strain CBS 109288 / IBT 7711) TaxID=1280523 RepID=A0A084AXK6_STACB|nr:hypothetical protein S7711_04050 [Stachybotrys chartarum IBT 7711]KFA50753.1 hypothetical protein S40293_06075 [Stachybotrys chartarum IBT 40293]